MTILIKGVILALTTVSLNSGASYYVYEKPYIVSQETKLETYVITKDGYITFKEYLELNEKEENISDKIRRYAEEYKADPILALNVACAESCTRDEENNIIFNSLAKNQNSTASGVFQFIKDTWNGYCEGDVFDAEDNVRCGVKILAKTGGIRHWEASRLEGFGGGWENNPYERFNVVN